jgi:hypothetical protein
MGLGLVALVGCTMAAQAAAGTFFRLEVGPAVAAGTNTKTKKAVLVVRPLVCDDPASVRMTGTAEGIVNGARQSVALTLVPLPKPGVYAVVRQWPDGGQWVLNLTGTCPAPKAEASTIVQLAGNAFIRHKTQVLRERATPAQVEASLSELLRSRS